MAYCTVSFVRGLFTGAFDLEPLLECPFGLVFFKVIVLPSGGMTKPGHSTPSHSQQKILEVAPSQYVCAGHPIFV